MIKAFLTSILLLVLLTGCGSNTPNSVDTPDLKNKVLVTKQVREDDIVSFGQYAEIWVAPYKDSDGDLYDERTMYFWVKEPDFVIGEKVPGANNKNEKSTSNESLYHTKFNIKFDKKNIQNNEDENTEIDDNKMELDSSVKEVLMKNKEEINE